MNVTGAQGLKKNFRTGFYLEQNNPNPFNKLTTINLILPSPARVSIIITNSYGKVVDKLISGLYESGSYNLEFFGDELPEGTYFYHLIADKYFESREMELIK